MDGDNDDVKPIRFLPPLSKIPPTELDIEVFQQKKSNKKKLPKPKVVKAPEDPNQNEENIFSIKTDSRAAVNRDELFKQIPLQSQDEQLPVKPKRNRKNRKLSVSNNDEYETKSTKNRTESEDSIINSFSQSEVNEDKRKSPSLAQSGNDYHNAQNSSVAKCFIERQSRFIPIDQAKEVKGIISIQPESAVSSQLALDIAITSQKYFSVFGIFCCGLFAGVALWQCIISYQLSSPKNDVHDYLTHYKEWILPIQSLFFLLSAITTVFAFDKYDVHRLQFETIKSFLYHQNGLIIIIIYPLTLLLSLCISDLDNKISLYHGNESLWTASREETVNEVIYWRNMNTARCIGAILGWMVVSILPKKDYFGEFLKKIREEDDSIPTISTAIQGPV